MRARGGVTQQANKTFFDVGTDDVLPLAGFVVGALPRKPDDIDKKPFGQPVAHGFLTLSLLPVFFESSFDVRHSGMGVNYGLNKVRFTAPVPVGSRLRGRMTLLSAEPIDRQGLQMTWQVQVEREGVSKPVCVAEALVRRYP